MLPPPDRGTREISKYFLACTALPAQNCTPWRWALAHWPRACCLKRYLFQVVYTALKCRQFLEPALGQGRISWLKFVTYHYLFFFFLQGKSRTIRHRITPRTQEKRYVKQGDSCSRIFVPHGQRTHLSNYRYKCRASPKAQRELMRRRNDAGLGHKGRRPFL